MKKKPPAHVGEALAKRGVHKALAAYVLAVPVLFLAASLFGRTNVVVLLWGLVTWGLAAAGLAWLLEKGGVRTAPTREKMKEVLGKALAGVLPGRRSGARAGPGE